MKTKLIVSSLVAGMVLSATAMAVDCPSNVQSQMTGLQFSNCQNMLCLFSNTPAMNVGWIGVGAMPATMQSQAMSIIDAAGGPMAQQQFPFPTQNGMATLAVCQYPSLGGFAVMAEVVNAQGKVMRSIDVSKVRAVLEKKLAKMQVKK